MTDLLDGSFLVALAIPDHAHHEAVHRWSEAQQHGWRFATCPITQGALVRLIVREGATTADAKQVLERFSTISRHEFWPDELSYTQVDLTGVLGHRQVTDAYLAQLARNRGARLVTLDDGLAALHHDVAVLVPTS